MNDAVLVVWKYKLIQNESETEQEGKVVDDDNSVSESTADSNDSEKEDLTIKVVILVSHTPLSSNA